MEKDVQKMIILLLSIAFIIILGVFLVNPTGYAIAGCADSIESYITLEPYKIYDYETKWGEFYTQILDKININIPSIKPNYISYDLCSPCKYNVTFSSNLPTNFFVFDQYNKERYFESRSAFPLLSERSSTNKTFSFEIWEKGKYYFVFDRSAQGTTRNDPATGRLIIYQLKGFNQTTEATKYRETTKYRNVTRCE